jgi:hypothetical protein
LTTAQLLAEPRLDQEDLIGSILLSVVAMAEGSEGWDINMKSVIDRFGSRAHVWRLLRDATAFRYFDLSISGAELQKVEDVCIYIGIATIREEHDRRVASAEIREELRRGRLRSEAVAREREGR